MATHELQHHGIWEREIQEEVERVGSSSSFHRGVATELDRHAIRAPQVEEEEQPARPSFEIGIAEVDTVRVSRKVILADLLKSLGGGAPTYVTAPSGAGFNGYAKAEVYGIKGNTRFHELYAYMATFCSTQDGAEEQAAEFLIQLLKSEFSFEVDDINWSVRNQYDHDRDASNVEIEMLRKENRELKEIVDCLNHGWSTTCAMLRSVHGMVSTARSAALHAFNTCFMLDPRGAMREVINRVAGVEEYIAGTLAEGSKDFNRAARIVDRMEK